MQNLHFRLFIINSICSLLILLALFFQGHLELFLAFFTVLDLFCYILVVSIFRFLFVVNILLSYFLCVLMVFYGFLLSCYFLLFVSYVDGIDINTCANVYFTKFLLDLVLNLISFSLLFPF